MSDPTALLEQIQAAEDAFGHAHGRPTFEPGVNSSPDASELRDHTSPYELAKRQVPLEDDTIDSLKTLYDARRTEHYYGTTVTTEEQAERMRAVATAVHEHLVTFDHDIGQFCLC